MLNGLQQKSILQPQAITEIEACLKERDTLPSHAALSPMSANNEDPSRPPGSPRGAKSNGVVRLDKKQIEQRIEEDRERHKRLRESIWAVNGDDTDEFDRLWEEASELGEDDFILAEEDRIERMAAAAAE